MTTLFVLQNKSLEFLFSFETITSVSYKFNLTSSIYCYITKLNATTV